MECKFHDCNSSGSDEKELIDTLWNVNIMPLSAFFFQIEELIDTLWNVNTVVNECEKRKIRINRYIMECK